MAKKNPCQGKHREFGNFVKTQGKDREFGNFVKTHGKHREFGLNTGNFVSSICQCSDSKSKGYCDSCRKKKKMFPRSWIGLPTQFCVSLYVILTNYVNWDRGKLRSDRENTGNLKIQFEWVP